MLTEQELKELYGNTYVEAFGAQQSQQRLARLIHLCNCNPLIIF